MPVPNGDLSMRRLTLVALTVLAATTFTVAPPASAQDAPEGALSVRIVARKIADGRVEFALQVPEGQRWLPTARFFPYSTADVDRWLRSSPYRLGNGSEVRIRARRLDSGKVEFALQVGEDRQWRPEARLFPYPTATVGRWLHSSWYTAGDEATPLDSTPHPSAAAPAPERPDCSFETTMSTVLPSVFQVITDRGTGTAFYVGENKFITAAHVIEGARTIRLQNHERTIRTIESTWTDSPSDVAILVADGSGIRPLAFGDERSARRGAQVAVVGYPGDNFDLSTPYPASIASGLVSTFADAADYDYVFYIRTDAAANPGNSGGPLITVCGNVIGIMSWKIVSVDVEGLNWAVSERTVRDVLRRALRPVAPPSAPPQTAASWAFWTSDNGDPHVTTEAVFYEYEDAIGDRDPPALVITCRSGRLAVYVWWDTFIAANVWTDEILVGYDFDDEGIIFEGWSDSTTYSSAWAPSPRTFVDSARRADEVSIVASNYDDDIVGGAIFELNGLDAALSRVPCY